MRVRCTMCTMHIWHIPLLCDCITIHNSSHEIYTHFFMKKWWYLLLVTVLLSTCTVVNNVVREITWYIWLIYIFVILVAHTLVLTYQSRTNNDTCGQHFDERNYFHLIEWNIKSICTSVNFIFRFTRQCLYWSTNYKLMYAIHSQ